MLPRLYAIVDAGCFASAMDPTAAMATYTRELLAACVTLLQYRNKTGMGREILSQAREMRRVVVAAVSSGAEAPGFLGHLAGTTKVVPLPGHTVPLPGHTGHASGTTEVLSLSKNSCTVRLIMNDRADLCLAAGFDGVHVGQEDLSPKGARVVVGGERWVGVSTHNPEQVSVADQQPVDYIAVGPVFATPSKANPDPVIGLEGVRRARALTRKPLVAIGGITRENCRQVIEAGADSVAVISDLLKEPRRAAEEFLHLMIG